MNKPLFPYDNPRITQAFKNASSYGPHEGTDYGRVGHTGAQNLGLPFRAPANCEIVHTSFSTKDYGNLVVMRVLNANGGRWIRYCHCDEIRLRSGFVKRGEVFATMGSSGNSTAPHLHFDVLVKKPSHWRFYSKNTDEWFEDPTIFWNTPLTTDIIPPSMEMLPKDSVINDIYRGLTGKKPSKDTIDWRITQGLNLVEITEDILKSDGDFYNKWVKPTISNLEKSLEDTNKQFQKALTDREECEKAFVRATEEHAEAIAKLRSEIDSTISEKFEHPVSKFLFNLILRFERFGA